MEDCRFKSPFTCLIAGASGSGKTTLIEEMIKRWKEVFDHRPTKIYIAYSHSQPKYESIKNNAPCEVVLIEGLPEDLVTDEYSLLIIDDLAETHASQIKSFYTRKSHHLKTDVITINQNLFDKNPFFRTVSLNSHYIIVHKNPRDQSQIIHLAKQIAPGDTEFLVFSFHDATRRPYTYLLCDLKQSTNNLLRIRSSVFPIEATVYVSKKKTVIMHYGLKNCT